MIRLFHVEKRFGPKVALRDISLDVERGEFLFVTGPSGAGKSTLLRVIFGAEPVDSGQILVNAVNLNRVGSRALDLLRRKIGFVFQDFKLLRTRCVFDNVALALEVAGMRRSEIRKRVRLALRWVSLEGRESAYPPQLSGGEQQRVAIARAVVTAPLMVLADEPTGNLDAQLTEEIMELFARIHHLGTTVLLATHSRELLERWPYRRIVLNQGSLVKDVREIS